jgi:hypothetical protein
VAQDIRAKAVPWQTYRENSMKKILVLASALALVAAPAFAQVNAFGVGGGVVITNTHSSTLTG